MSDEIDTRRRLIILLVVATVVIFVGLVWLIATWRPWNLLAAQDSTPTTNVQQNRDCTSPISYWRAHPELYPSQIIIGGMVYREFELEALLLDNTTDIAQQLKAQMAVAFLNGQSGADQSSIEATLFEAYGWLERNPAGSQVTGEELERGRQLYDLLDAYNTGLAGVVPCVAELAATRTATPVVTANLESSLTPSQTGTPTASGTPSVTEINSTSTFVYASPTSAATRTSKPPVQAPTDTPIQPTAPPPPTDTQRPPDTPTFTPVPPTPTFPPPTPTLPIPTPTLP